MRKTSKLMKRIEERYGQPIDQLLRDWLTDRGLVDTAAEWGVSKGALGYWVLTRGLTVHRVVTGPGEEVLVRRASGELVGVARHG